MPKVKIVLEKGEDILGANQKLLKALEAQASGKSHEEERFDDPAMQDLADYAQALYIRVYANMLNQIQEELDKEYSNGSI